MSAARTNFGPLGYGGLRMTAGEFLSLGEMDGRFELVHGVVLMSPSVRPLHWFVLNEINKQLLAFQSRGGNCYHCCEIDIQFDDHTVYQPDVSVFVGPAPWPIPRFLPRVPDLAIEVLSPGSKPMDLITKRDDYDRFGVPEYWVVDPEDASVRSWVRTPTGYAEPAVSGEKVVSTAISGFTLDVAPIARLVFGP